MHLLLPSCWPVRLPVAWAPIHRCPAVLSVDIDTRGEGGDPTTHQLSTVFFSMALLNHALCHSLQVSDNYLYFKGKYFGDTATMRKKMDLSKAPCLLV
jgi:hypothetical protein